MKPSKYYIALINPVQNFRKYCTVNAWCAKDAAVEAVAEYGPDGFYVVESVTRLG